MTSVGRNIGLRRWSDEQDCAEAVSTLREKNIAIETWTSGGRMYMVKCNNPDCYVPVNGYPTGRNLEEVKAE